MGLSDLSLSRETAISLSAKVTMGVFSLGIAVLVAQSLGASGLGTYFVLLAVGEVLAMLPSGVSRALRKRVSEIQHTAEEFLGLALVGIVVYTVVLGAAILAIFDLFPIPWNISQNMLYGLIVAFGGMGLFDLASSIYSGQGNPGKSVWFETVQTVLATGAQLWLLINGYGVAHLLLAHGAASIASSLLLVRATAVRPAIPSRGILETVYDFARWSVASKVVTTAYGRSNSIFTGAFLGPTLAGFYEASARLAMPSVMFASSMGYAISVKSSYEDSKGGEVRRDIVNAMSYAGLVGIPLLFGALAVGEPLLKVLYGKEFEAAWIALVLLAAARLFGAYQTPLANGIEGVGRPDTLFRVRRIMVAIHLPMLVVLGFKFQLLGVVSAIATSAAIEFALFYWKAIDEFGSGVFSREPLYQVFSGSIMLGVTVALRQVIPITSPVRLAIVIGIGGITYFGTLVAISPMFRNLVAGFLSLETLSRKIN